MQHKPLFRALPLVLAAILLLSMNLFAQLTTGKVEGTVRDKDTGQPLKGAQVTIEGTRLGNLTNDDGYFFILNIPPGRQNITFSFTGYQKTTISNVSVLAGQTMTVNGALSSTVVELSGITVEAESEPMVPRDNTVTKRRLTAEKMGDIPSTVLEDMLVLEAGIQTGGGGARDRGLKLRGGRIGEEAMVVDGMMVRNYTANVFSGGGEWVGEFETGVNSEDATPMEFSVAAVEEVDILTGGFQAEYGNAQSGIVNVVTKEGGSELRGDVKYTTDGQQPRTSDWGYNQLNVNVGGPVPLVKDFYFQMSGEAQGQDDRTRTHADEGFRGIDQNFVDRLNNAVRNDPYFAGRTPFSLDMLKAGQQNYNALTGKDVGLFTASNPVRLPGSWQDRTMLSGKLTWSPFSGLKLIGTNNWFRNQYSYPQGGTNDASGNYFRTGIIGREDPLYSALFQSRPWKEGETEVYIPQSSARRGRTNTLMAGFDWNLMRSSERNAALQFRYSSQRVVEIPASTLKENWERTSWMGWSPHDVQFAGETWPDREMFGINNGGAELKKLYYPDGQASWNVIVPIVYPYMLQDESLYNLAYRYLRESQDNFKADLDLQWNRKNRAKAGFEFHNISNLKYGTGGGYSKQDPRAMFEYNPVIYSGYGQNRTDLGDLVIDYGLRYDAFDPVENWGASALDIAGSQVFVKTQDEWSPRFNVAFPVTDKAQLRFSYGAFTQMSSLDYVYGVSSGGSDLRNRGDLEFSRTDAFEGGINYLLAQDVSLDIVTFYRDVMGNVSSKDFYVDFWDTARNQRVREAVDGWSNRDNGNIKGMDLTVHKRFSNNYSLDLNYTLQFSRTTGSQVGTSYYSRLDPSTGESFTEPDELNPIDGDRTHQIKTRFTYMFPREFKAGTMAGTILRDFKVNAVYQVLSGSPSGGSSIGGLVYGTNYFRGKWFTDLNLRFDKSFRLGKARRVGVFTEVFNALNRKNLVTYPSGYSYESSKSVTAGVDVRWDVVSAQPDLYKMARFAADFNGDGILTVEEAALGDMAQDMIFATMDKSSWGSARQVRAGVSLSF